MNHVFDIYAGYHLSRDSNKVQLEMLEYVTVNSERYDWGLLHPALHEWD